MVRAGGQTEVPWLYFLVPIICTYRSLGMETEDGAFWKLVWKPWKANAGRGVRKYMCMRTGGSTRAGVDALNPPTSMSTKVGRLAACCCAMVQSQPSSVLQRLGVQDQPGGCILVRYDPRQLAPARPGWAAKKSEQGLSPGLSVCTYKLYQTPTGFVG